MGQWTRSTYGRCSALSKGRWIAGGVPASGHAQLPPSVSLQPARIGRDIDKSSVDGESTVRTG